MFDGCIKLVGGNGTVYDSENPYGEYACIDKPEQPGYFTMKATTKITAQPADYSGAICLAAGNVGVHPFTALEILPLICKSVACCFDCELRCAANTLSVGVTEGRNGLQYRCVVKDSSGQEVASNAATLKVLTKITKQPVDASGAIGDTVKFTVTATGSGLTYQWQYLKGSEWVKSGLTGAKTATLSVPVTETRNGLKYRCVIKDANGKTVNSNAAALKVATKITKQPADASSYIGDIVKFTATATGAGLTYQWQYDNGSGWMNSNVTGSKTNTLSLYVTEARNGIKYRCVIKDTNGKTVNSNAATLKVLTKITKQPADASGYIGDTVKFTATATGAGLTYQWQYDNGSGWMNSNVTGSKTNTLSVYVTEARNGLKYRCIIKDANGKTLTSSAATLTVKK